MIQFNHLQTQNLPVPFSPFIDEANFYQREWIPALRRLSIRPRPYYNCQHTYIPSMLNIGTNPLFVARQTGTSLEMIETHYGSRGVVAEPLDELIDAAAAASRNPTGTSRTRPSAGLRPKGKMPRESRH